MWNRKSCDMSTGESERSELFSSHSDEKKAMTESPTEGLESPEKTSKPSITEDELKESVKILTEKLSAALVNVKAKEDLVKQHAKVAEEAVAGWEKAENEVASIKQQLDLALQQNLNLEVKASHLDGALKECVRQLRQARDEHDKQADLEKQVANLQAEAEATKAENSYFLEKLEALEKENSSLKQELFSRFDELEIMTIERDLSTEAAEAASKMQLESFKKVAKLEAECRKLQSITRKLSPQKSVESEPLILDLDQFKKEKPINNNLTVKIDMMDDFLEMERLAALDDIKSNAPIAEDINPLRDQLDSMSTRITELEEKLEKIEAEKLELQNALDESLESLKATEIKLEEVQEEIIVVNEAREMLELQIVGLEAEARTVSENVDELKLEIEEKRFALEELKFKCEELENELSRMIQESEIQQNEKSKGEMKINELKLEIEEERKVTSELWSKCRELENGLSRTIEEERKVSSELRSKCRELENELSRTIEESALQQNANSNGEVKVKQEDLAVAADKLTECQKTIASLGRQLESLATLEDFLIDTSNIPGLTRGGSPGEDIWRLSSNEMFMPRHEFSRISMENYSHLENGIEGSLPSSSLSAPSMNHSTAAKSRNSFGKFFSRSKNVVEFENGQD